MLRRFIQGFILGFLFITLFYLLDTNRLAYLILLTSTPIIFISIFYKEIR